MAEHNHNRDRQEEPSVPRARRLAYAVLAFPIFIVLALVTAVCMPFALFIEALRDED